MDNHITVSEGMAFVMVNGVFAMQSRKNTGVLTDKAIRKKNRALNAKDSIRI